jgi:P-type Ca2+ transporter type 2C
MIPADAIICDGNVVKANESALTGESDDLKKSRVKDPFLLSSCLITEGEECRAVVIGIGLNSQWGKIKANLVSEAVNTPLQEKLELMAEQVVYFLPFKFKIHFLKLCPQ